MKNFSSLLIFTLLVVAMIGQSAFGIGLDLSTHNTLIQKLETSVNDIDDKATKAKIHLRLGDLHADQARIEHLNNKVASANKSRNSAINYYQKAFQKSGKDNDPRILLQLSHLYVQLGQSRKAERIFKNIIKDRKNRPKDLVGEAYAGLGEIQFLKSDFKNAGQNFKKALYYPIAKVIDVSHRLAWCEFNSGNFKTAEILTSNTLNRKDITSAQKADLSRDLATFMAKGPISEAKIKSLLANTPDNFKKQNLFYLGQEADRLGNYKGSRLVWLHIAKMDDVTAAEKAEMTLRTAQSNIDTNNYKEGLNNYSQYFKEFRNIDCDDNKTTCGDLKARARNLVHNWLKKEKARPTHNLKNGLVIFTDNNNQDIEMLKWAGNISRYLKDYKAAIKTYTQAATVAKGKEQTELLKGLVETAEESDDTKLMRQAYLTFLKINPNAKEAGEVKYQLAYLDYREKSYSKSAKNFFTLTNDSNVPYKLKLQAADLSLDSLAILNDRSQIEKFSLIYANRFKKQKIKFLSVARKAIVNESLEQYKVAKNNDRKVRSALNKLLSAPLAGASKAELLQFQLNRLEMASAIKDLKQMDKAAIAVIYSKSATAENTENALEKRLFVAESELRFQSALALAKKMKFPKLDRASRELKLGILSDLAGKNPEPYYKNYIKYVSSRRAANVIRLEMLKRANNPWALFKDYRRALASTPDIYTQALVECYGRSPNQKNLEKYAQSRLLKKSYGASTINYQLELMTYDKYRLGFRGLKLDSRSDQRLANSMNKRLKLLKDLENYAKLALNRYHLGIQIRALDLMSREYKKLYMQILGLPVPRGLKIAQRNQYKSLLEKQALPYLQKSNEIKEQFKDLWSNNKQFEAMIADLDEVSDGEKKLLTRDLNTLLPFASKRKQSQIQSAIKKSNKTDHRYLVQQFNKLKNDPFDKNLIRKIKKLEEKRGKTAMVTFLESRENALNKGKI